MDRGEQRNKRKWKFKERKKHPYRKGGKFRTYDNDDNRNNKDEKGESK